jgi:hypothetical protein
VPASRPVLRLVLQAPIRSVRIPLRRRKASIAVPSRRPDRVLLAILALATAMTLGACGGAQQTKTVTVAATTPAANTGTETTTSDAKQGAASGSDGAIAPRPKTTLVACDADVRIKAATTTCAFAENVFYEYWRGLEYSEVSDIKAFSPALGRFLAIDCDHGDAVECRTDAGALVRFPQTAVAAYTIENAAKYSRGHKVSDEPHPANPAPTPPSGGGDGDGDGDGDGGGDGGGDCDPSYDGACLDASASDYDCEGGTGDGPEYTGTVTVIGDDHFGLDRDGDGVACES